MDVGVEKLRPSWPKKVKEVGFEDENADPSGEPIVTGRPNRVALSKGLQGNVSTAGDPLYLVKEVFANNRLCAKPSSRKAGGLGHPAARTFNKEILACSGVRSDSALRFERVLLIPPGDSK
jgi:hypothetical protein